ncbi:MAG: glycosyltransferase [Bacteroidales bacterium]|nr:glycosyltransferase [Bacteroidales bacterium]
MDNCLDNSYSTTKLLTKERPIIEYKFDDKFITMLFLPRTEGRKEEGGLRLKGFFKKNYKDLSLITIIVVVLNGEKYIEESIKSVINQTYSNIEFIIIDGGSNDGTIDIIKKYENKIDYWISEQDEGIYDAMNKGVQCCSGKYILHLGDDDYIYEGSVIKRVSSYINNYPDIDALIGSIRNSDLTVFKGSVNKELHFKNTVHHQGVFYNIKLFKKYGLYNINYQILADFEFNKRVFLFNRPNYIIIKVQISYCRIEGISKTLIKRLRKERISLITSWLAYLKYKIRELGKK